MASSRITTTLFTAALVAASAFNSPAWAAELPVADAPLYLATAQPPLNMLVMGKDHKLYYEAYNDASDLNGDGALDIGYRGHVLKDPAPAAGSGESLYVLDYYGYFNSHVCYSYVSGRFSPVSATANKQCNNLWSGDFLNYLTTGRGDALKKVLYGGDRFVDTDSQTVLQTNYVTHDAHSWGKEYKSIARDGYNIANYAPLTEPDPDTRHLFAVTSLTNPDGTADGGAPVLRILEDSPYRIWEWVSIEGPVADTRCLHGGSGPNCIGGSTPNHPGHPTNYADFTTRLETPFAIAANKYGADVVRNTINCNSADCNPNGSDDDYMTIVTGRFRTADINAAAGTYEFRVNGDDAFDVQITNNAGTTVLGTAGCYGAGGFRTCAGGEVTTVTLARNTSYRFKFRQEEAGGGDGYSLEWRKTGGSNQFAWTIFDSSSTHNSNVNTGHADRIAPTFRFYNLRPPQTNGSTRQADKFIRVIACPADNAALRESNCKQYPDGNWKPTGILHDFGETDRMYFGLMTGSQKNNLDGGILRRNLHSFANEINADDGTFRVGANSVLDGSDGIVGSIKSLRMIGGRGGEGINWAWGGGTGDCPSIGERAIVSGECRMWGNPIGEMMFETLRYFAGGTAYTGFTTAPVAHNVGNAEETTMTLTSETWRDPYRPTANGGLGYSACSKPVMTVISDINPSYDSNLPGNPWNSVSITSPASISSFDADAVGQDIWDHEFGGTQTVYIGQSGTGAGSADSAPSAKSASSFGNIRGLSPEEPTKEGTYYSAAVAYYGWTNDQVNALSTENLRTYSVAVASPLPKIEFPIGDRMLTLLPFAKTVSGTFGGGTQKPTNTIVDFYVQQIVNLPGQPTDANINGGRGYAVFRINYEDVEQGNDHDMDAIVRYEVIANANNTVTVNLTSEYAAGSANHALGYTMSGSTKDGIYLEVCDLRDGVANDGTTASCAHQTRYSFNTPAGRDPGFCATNPLHAECAGLPPNASRTFSPGATDGAITLRDPLWYAAKYGGFTDVNDNDVPDDANGTTASEWDQDGDGNPDKYFLVTNALNLKDQLERAFSQIEADSNPSGGVAASGTRREVGFLAYVPEYDSGDWTGDVKAYFLQPGGALGLQVWSAVERLPNPNSRNIFVSMPANNGELELREFLTANLGDDAAEAEATLGFAPGQLSGSFAATVDDAVAFLRGDASRELRQNGTFRDRYRAAPTRNNHRAIGDILNSQPEVLSRGSSGYASLLVSEGGGKSIVNGVVQYNPTGGAYGDFIRDVKLTRAPVLFVGANDGMLHALDATFGAQGGRELFAVIPNSAVGRMASLVQPGYTHRYFVDASPAQGDAYISIGGTGPREWRTILLSGNGAGGRSLMALDVTDPVTDGFDEDNFLWEFTDSDLGLTTSRPQVVLMQDGNWYAVIGNGLNSDSEGAYLYLIRLDNPAQFIKIPAGVANTNDPNGMMSFVAVDTLAFDTQGTALLNQGDLKADVIYAADYHGNVWKFDVSSTNPANWGVAGAGPLYTAVDEAGNRQNITGGLNVTLHPILGNMLYFGTGRYLLDGDNVVSNNPQVQSFYAVWDNTSLPAVTNGISGRASLVEQFIGTNIDLGATFRTVSDRSVNYATGARGWFVDLKVDVAATGNGERFIGEPRVELGRVIFTTFTPIGSECDPGGVNWLYALSAVTGGPALEFADGAPCPGCGGTSLTPPGQSGPPAISPPLVTDPGNIPPLNCIPGVTEGCELPEPPCVPGVDEGCDLPSDGSSIPGRACTVNLGVLLAEGLRTFSSVSCGRQSWRQVN